MPERNSLLRSSASIFLAVAFSLFSLCRVEAQESPFLLTPKYTDLYKKSSDKLSERERWRVMIHGLRMAPLDPTVWGIRVTERTENRRLVPMRPFVLRESMAPRFFLGELKVRFKFVRATLKDMQRKFHSKDPLFDIAFGGEFEGKPGDVSRDRGYFLRLTAIPELESGFFYQSKGKVEPILKLDPSHLDTAREYELILRGERDRVTAALDGKDLLALKGQELNKGIVSLMTGWNPIKVSELSVKGYVLNDDGSKKEVVASGLIDIGEDKKEQEDDV